MQARDGHIARALYNLAREHPQRDAVAHASGHASQRLGTFLGGLLAAAL